MYNMLKTKPHEAIDTNTLDTASHRLAAAKDGL